MVPLDSPTVWADREELKTNLEKLLDGAAERRRSMVLGMWGYVGAGKSHTLRYFKNLYETQKSAFAIYAPIPKQITGFADIYRQAFFGNLDFVRFASRVGQIYSDHYGMKEYEMVQMLASRITGNWLDMAQVLVRMGAAVAAGGPLNPYVQNVNSWLAGVRLSKSELRQLGLSANLVYDADFVKAAGSIVRTLAFSDDRTKPYSLVLWELDDCHFLAELKRKSKMYVGIQQGLRDLFDSCPQGLVIIIAFAARQASALEDLIIPDVLSRIQQRIPVPPLDNGEALAFVKGLLTNKQFRSSAAHGDYYPLDPKSARTLVELTLETADLTPRNLMKALAYLVDQAETEIFPKIIEDDYVVTKKGGIEEALRAEPEEDDLVMRENQGGRT